MLTQRPFAEAVTAESGTVAVGVLVSLYAFNLSEEMRAAIGVAGVWAVRLILPVSTGLSLVKLGL